MRLMKFFCLRLVLLGGLVFTPAMIQAQSVDGDMVDPQAFKAWTADYLKRYYASAPPPVVAQAFRAIEPIQRVIELDRAQPEFTLSFWQYIDRVINQERLNRGQELTQLHQNLLGEVTQIYGIPPEVIVAFWGIETGYGAYFGKFDLIPALATLGFDSRRGKFFEQELTHALSLLVAGDLKLENAYGSWAGAHGNFQFMPSSMNAFALDADGGGIDLIHSLTDAMHSAGNYLQQSGWKAGQRWGREVILPPNFDYQQNYSKMRPLSDWQGLGIKTITGAPLPNAQGFNARLIIPAGHLGPKYMVYDNFDVILRWNRSNFYALAVGLLADGFIKAPHALPVIKGAARPKNDIRLDRATILAVQTHLNKLGKDTKGIDGILGSATKRALRQWQLENNMIADGHLSKAMLDRMGIHTQ
ncbi:MAG: lytic murein transglycosylase [Alphaproteobacteria bacterium]